MWCSFPLIGNIQAKLLYSRYIHPSAKSQINVSAKLKDELEATMATGIWDQALYNGIQGSIHECLKFSVVRDFCQYMTSMLPQYFTTTTTIVPPATTAHSHTSPITPHTSSHSTTVEHTPTLYHISITPLHLNTLLYYFSFFINISLQSARPWWTQTLTLQPVSCLRDTRASFIKLIRRGTTAQSASGDLTLAG